MTTKMESKTAVKKNQTVYIVRGSEDGILGVFTDLWEAWKLQRDYIKANSNQIEKTQFSCSSYQQCAIRFREGYSIARTYRKEKAENFNPKVSSVIESFEMNIRYAEGIC